MPKESLLPRWTKRVEHALQAGLVVVALGACGGGQPVPSSSPDSRSFVSTPTAKLILEPTLSPFPILESTVVPTANPTLSPTQTNREPHPPSTEIVAAYSFAMPALGINAPIQNWSECGDGGTLPKKTVIYAYTCVDVGKNNLFLMGHAADVFRNLYRAKDGQIAYYTDPSGKVSKYYVAWHKYQTFADWAKNWWGESSPFPVITLLTCANGPKGEKDAYRITVRLVPIGATVTPPPDVTPTPVVTPTPRLTETPTAPPTPSPTTPVVTPTPDVTPTPVAT